MILFCSSSLLRVRCSLGYFCQGAALLLRKILIHLDDSAYQRRIDSAIRFASVSMNHQARAPNAFEAADADLFINSLIDALEGLLSAPASGETIASTKSLASEK